MWFSIQLFSDPSKSSPFADEIADLVYRIMRMRSTPIPRDLLLQFVILMIFVVSFLIHSGTGFVPFLAVFRIRMHSKVLLILAPPCSRRAKRVVGGKQTSTCSRWPQFPEGIVQSPQTCWHRVGVFVKTEKGKLTDQAVHEPWTCASDYRVIWYKNEKNEHHRQNIVYLILTHSLR